MRKILALAVMALPIGGCSQSATGPTTSPVITAPSSAPARGFDHWQATSTVVDVSATANGCPVDHTIGQTRTVDWAIEQPPYPSSSVSIFFLESVDSQGRSDYMSDPAAPLYYGSLTGEQFATVAEQDGQPGCFVWHGDFTGRFSADGRTFDAVENIKYVHFGEDEMVVRRHWLGTRQ